MGKFMLNAWFVGNFSFPKNVENFLSTLEGSWYSKPQDKKYKDTTRDYEFYKKIAKDRKKKMWKQDKQTLPQK